FKTTDGFNIMVGAPIGVSDSPNRLVFVELSLNDLYALFNNDLQLAESLETILVQKKGNSALVLNPVKSDTSFALSKFVELDSSSFKTEATAIQKAVSREEGFGSAFGFDGKEI